MSRSGWAKIPVKGEFDSYLDPAETTGIRAHYNTKLCFCSSGTRVGKNPGLKKKPAQWVFLGFLGFFLPRREGF